MRHLQIVRVVESCVFPGSASQAEKRRNREGINDRFSCSSHDCKDAESGHSNFFLNPRPSYSRRSQIVRAHNTGVDLHGSQQWWSNALENSQSHVTPKRQIDLKLALICRRGNILSRQFWSEAKCIVPAFMVFCLWAILPPPDQQLKLGEFHKVFVPAQASFGGTSSSVA